MWPTGLPAGVARQYFLRERRLAGAVMPSKRSAPHAPADPELPETVENLLARKAWMAGLPPALMEHYQKRTSAGRRNIIKSLLLWIAALNFSGIAFDLWTVPAHLIGSVILCRMAISATFITAALTYRTHVNSAAESTFLIVPCLIMTIVAGIFGLAADSLLLERYLINSVLVIATVIIIAPIKIRQTFTLAVLTILVLSAFLFACPDFPIAAKLQIIAFHALGLLALTVARQAQNRIQYRFFLMTLRNEIQVKQMADLNERLTDLSLTDPLTGVANRRRFEERLQKLALEQTGVHGDIAVLMIDIDHFKLLNDKLGHLEGDRCLRVVADTIRQSVRTPDDLVARYGGEEFVALLAIQQDEAGIVAERIRQSVANLQLSNPGVAGGFVTVSIGIATNAVPGNPLQTAVHSADQALYMAKKLGRNRVHMSDTRVLAAAS